MSDGSTARLTGWGGTPASTASLRSPADLDELRRLVLAAPPRGILARGLGRSYGDAAQNAGGVVLGRWRPDAPVVVDSAARTVTLTGGTSLSRALRHLLPAAWVLPVLPGTRFVTAGGAVAADVHGKNHHRDGSFGHWVRRLTLLDGCGEVRTLAPDQDGEAFWATVGGLGLTGVVLDVTVEVVPAETAWVVARSRRMTSLEAAFDAMESSPARHHVAWVDGAPGAGFGRVVLDEGDPATLCDLPPHRCVDPLRYRPRQVVAVPPVRANLVRPGVVRAFNQAWWRSAPAERTRVLPLDAFFHPLDRVRAWNRLYGARGFLQWQCVVPLEARDVVTSALRRLAGGGSVPSLVVLKRFGDAAPGPLSFPMRGWTLAVDLAAGDDRLPGELDRLDATVAEAGGRLYLVKDSRLSARSVAVMYPEVDSWRATRARLDPRGVFRSDLALRVGLL